MPTYEFRCPRGHEFEKFYRTISSAESSATCPVCGETSERMMSATGFAFKGSGFYLTDYGKNAHREKGTPTPASPASGDSAKSDAPRSDAAKADAGGGDSAKPAPKADAAPAPAPAPKKSAE